MKDDMTNFEGHELAWALEGVAKVLSGTRLGSLLSSASATGLGVPHMFSITKGETASLERSRDYDRECEPSDFAGIWRAYQTWPINLSDLARRDARGETIIAEIAGLSASPNPAVAAIASFAAREWIGGVEAVLDIATKEVDGPAAIVSRVIELLEEFNGDLAVEMDDALDPVEYGACITRGPDGGFEVSEYFMGDMDEATGHKVTVANLDAAAETMREACNVPAAAPGLVSR